VVAGEPGAEGGAAEGGPAQGASAPRRRAPFKGDTGPEYELVFNSEEKIRENIDEIKVPVRIGEPRACLSRVRMQQCPFAKPPGRSGQHLVIAG